MSVDGAAMCLASILSVLERRRIKREAEHLAKAGVNDTHSSGRFGGHSWPLQFVMPTAVEIYVQAEHAEPRGGAFQARRLC
jgi:hypothetical protein